MMLPVYMMDAVQKLAATTNYPPEVYKVAAANATDPMVKEALGILGAAKSVGKTLISNPAQVVIDSASRMVQKAKETNLGGGPIGG